MNSSSELLTRGWLAGLYTVFIQAPATTIPIRPVTKKTHVQPNRAVIQPESGAKRKVAKYWAELKMAAAVPRSDAGNQAATMRLFAGKAGASAKPSSKRRPKNMTSANPAVNNAA